MKNKLIAYIKAGYSGLFLITSEEHRATAEIAAAAKATGRAVYRWSCTAGLVGPSGDSLGKQDPGDMLNEFIAMGPKTVLIAHDFHAFLKGDPYPAIVRRLREALFTGKASGKHFIITGAALHLPQDLQKEILPLEFKLPDRDQLREVLSDFLAGQGKPQPTPETEIEIVRAAGGLTTTEAENAFAFSLVQHGKIVPKVVATEKAQTVKKNGVLEIFDSALNLDDIGGLDELKDWMCRRRSCYGDDAIAYGLKTPKGVVCFGPPGTGKSLVAKATCNILGGLPLLRCDVGAIFGSLVGESERNMRTVIETAEAVAPCIGWIDELDKAFSGSKSSGSTDGGTGSRVLGTFLQWMNDKTSPVFVVATANHPESLPSELLRKGRWDELFFVDLPNAVERFWIWSIQLKRTKRLVADFDLPALVSASNGYTGAEIETVVTDAMFFAFSDSKREFDTTDILGSLAATTPVSKMMAEEITKMRDWAKGRARLASRPEPVTALNRRSLDLSS